MVIGALGVLPKVENGWLSFKTTDLREDFDKTPRSKATLLQIYRDRRFFYISSKKVAITKTKDASEPIRGTYSL